MEKVPFSIYDFFAYLSAGAVWILTADYVFGTGLLHQKDIAPILAVALVIVAYVCGQIVAHFASFFLEQLFVFRLLRRPSLVLMGERSRWTILKFVFPNYFRPLPVEIRNRIEEQAASRGVRGRGEGLFLHAYAVLTSEARFQSRLDDFRNQYGFARNMAFAFLISSASMLVAQRFAWHSVQLRWAILGAVAGVALVYRYLKFFRQYSYELLIRYAELPVPAERVGRADG